MREEGRDGGSATTAVALGWIAGLASLAGAGWLLSRLDRTGVTGGMLLLVAALGALGVAIGSRPYGDRVEGRLDLSVRLALGLLGGALGGLAAHAMALLLDGTGLSTLLGVDLPLRYGATRWMGAAAAGAGWGLLFGALFHRLPGRGAVARGAWFSLVPAAWLLLKVYPLDAGAGWLGLELGWLAPLVVLFQKLIWGWIAGSTVRWGGTTDLAPVSRSLGA